MFRSYQYTMAGKYCKDCKERYPACHDHCEKYKEALQEHKDRLQTINEKKDKDRDYYGFKRNNIRATIKKTEGASFKRKG